MKPAARWSRFLLLVRFSWSRTIEMTKLLLGDPVPTVTVVYPSVLDRAQTRQLLEAERALIDDAPSSLPGCEGGERVDAAKLEQAGIPLDALADHIQDIRERLGELTATATHTTTRPVSIWLRPKVLLFLSRSRSLEEQQRIIAEVELQFQKVCRRTVVIVPKYLDPLPVSDDEVDAACDKTVREVLQEAEGEAQSTAQELAESLRETNRRIHAEMHLYAHATRPTVTEKIITWVAVVRAAMEAVNRVIQAMRMQPLEAAYFFFPLIKCLALSFAGAMAEYFSVAYFFSWQAWVEKLRLPVTGMLDKVDSLLGPPQKRRARRAWQAAKLLAANVALNALARPLLMQDFAALLYGTAYADLGDFLNLLANGMLGASFSTAGFVGAHWLRQKGWITETELKLSFLCLGMFDVLSNFFNSDRTLRHLRIFTQGPQWAAYGLIALVAIALPERRGRFVLIDDALGQRRSEIDALASTERNFRLKRGRDVLRRFVEKSQRLAGGKGNTV
jgi:hypothetical protein